MSYDETPPQHRSSRRALKQRSREERGQRRRKIQALAAGGLVLGVGATATLAAWTDQETTAGSFASGEFALESNTVGAQWASTEKMGFQNIKLAPGQSVYAPVVLRSSPETTVDGEVTVSGTGQADGLNPSLRFRAVTVDPVENAAALNCTADTFSSASGYVFGSKDGYVSMSGDVQSDSLQALASHQSETIAYCFEVQLDPEANNDTQNLTADYSWTFNAQSVTP